MAGKIIDIYGIIGLLIAIIVAIISVYVSGKEIILQYFFISLIGIMIIGIVIFLFNKFTGMDEQIEKINKEVERFKTLERYNDLRLDIRELKREVFK